MYDDETIEYDLPNERNLELSRIARELGRIADALEQISGPAEARGRRPKLNEETIDKAIVDLIDEEGNATYPDVSVYEGWIVVEGTVIPRERVNWVQQMPGNTDESPEGGS